MDREALRAALAAVGVAELVAVSKPTWRPSAEQAFEGSLMIAGSSFRFGFCLPDEFPGALPKVFALSPELLRLPHVDEQGFVCAFEDENTLHDYRAANELVGETVERARCVVEDGLLSRNRGDYWDEFEAYWPRGVDAASAVTPGDEPLTIKASFDGRQLLAVADSDSALRSMFPCVFRTHLNADSETT